MEKMTNYNVQAEKFLQDIKTTFKSEFTEHKKYFEDDKETRDVYTITLTREGKKPFVFSFGQSIAKSGTINSNKVYTEDFMRKGNIIAKPKDYAQKRESPTAYDALSCLTKYEVGTFDDFCSDFGYESNSKAEKIYIAVQKEYSEVKRLFGDVIDQLAEIN